MKAASFEDIAVFIIEPASTQHLIINPRFSSLIDGAVRKIRKSCLHKVACWQTRYLGNLNPKSLPENHAVDNRACDEVNGPGLFVQRDPS